MKILRRGQISNGIIGTVDDLTLVYIGNKLRSAVDASDYVMLEGSLDFDLPRDATYGTILNTNYTYDSSGRMIQDPSQGIESITYHVNDRPSVITTKTKTHSYEYDLDGNKLSVKTESNSGTLPGQTSLKMISRHAYCGSCEFDYTLINKRRNSTLTRINLPWGYIDANGKEYRYITDYQGNIRAVVDSTGTAIQTTDYYPYGLPMATTTGTAANRYKYGAKEFETRNGLNFHDFEARMLFNDITLFSRPDDLAGKYPHLNPYLYCAANPLMFIDPSGKDITVAVSAKTVGQTNIYLYTSNERKNHKITGPLQMQVPVYKVILSNESGSSNTYYYTRKGYRKNVNDQSQPAVEVTFDVCNDGDTFSGVIKDRWNGKNNVLELRDKDDITKQEVSARKGKTPTKRTAIQFHVLGATDGCLMSVGLNSIDTDDSNSEIRQDLPKTSSAAQRAFMNDILKYIKEDISNNKTGNITIIFQQIYKDEEDDETKTKR